MRQNETAAREAFRNQYEGDVRRDLSLEKLHQRPRCNGIERVHRIPFVVDGDTREVVRPLLFGRGEYRRTQPFVQPAHGGDKIVQCHWPAARVRPPCL